MIAANASLGGVLVNKNSAGAAIAHVAPAPTSRGWLTDILDDGGGPLLTLMGISSGAYVLLKTNEP